MLSDRVSNPGPLTYESCALPIALRGPAVSYVAGWLKCGTVMPVVVESTFKSINRGCHDHMFRKFNPLFHDSVTEAVHSDIQR